MNRLHVQSLPIVRIGVVLITGLLLASPPALFADPPPWAPAHGWRKKHDPYYQGYTGTRWPEDYGILDGRCNREAIGAAIGGAVGGIIGSKVGEGGARTVATIIGTVLGAVMGAKLGEILDEADRACIGHALELVRDETRVSWVNPEAGVSYLLKPLGGYRSHGMPCREFSMRVTRAGRSETRQGRACRKAEGTWEMVRF
jgi:surface antigen